ncbi:MAG: hypothetical protein CMJ94_09590 [Planctomycetes bacterium]|nr:hypothetical protein [Planctomycetota bacterium]
MRAPLRLGLSLLALGAVSCSSFRAAWTGAFNTDLEQSAAPRLVGGAWIDDQGIDDQPRELSIDSEMVVAFFRPG